MQFLTRWMSGSFLSSRIRLSISISEPRISKSASLPWSRLRSRMSFGITSRMVANGCSNTLLMSSCSLATVADRDCWFRAAPQRSQGGVPRPVFLPRRKLAVKLLQLGGLPTYSQPGGEQFLRLTQHGIQFGGGPSNRFLAGSKGDFPARALRRLRFLRRLILQHP